MRIAEPSFRALGGGWTPQNVHSIRHGNQLQIVRRKDFPYRVLLSFAKILSAFEINSIASVAFTRVLV